MKKLFAVLTVIILVAGTVALTTDCADSLSNILGGKGRMNADRQAPHIHINGPGGRGWFTLDADGTGILDEDGEHIVIFRT
jgi:autotransporter translocation and assembly factor TamB